MDPFSQWPFPGAVPNDGWNTGMPGQCDQYPNMAFSDDFGAQPQLQQPQQPSLAELQPLQQLTNLHSGQPTTHNHPAHGMPAGIENALPTPPASSTSSSSGSIYDRDPFGMQQQYDKPVETLFTPPPSDTSDGPIDPPPPPPKEKRKSQRGQKRKRGEEGEEEINETAPPTPSLEVATVDHYMHSGLFWKVVGRLSVVGAQKTYYVTAAEIKRRTNLPECLNKSHLGPLLRRGKVKGCGSDLQVLLEQSGLSAHKIINRKQYPLTTLSALLEEEALQLSSDHRELVSEHFPYVPLARLIIGGIPTPAHLGAAAAEIKIAKTTMASLLSIVEKWTDGGWEVSLPLIVSSPLSGFALATHGLGVEECRLFFSLFSRFLAILDEECDAHMETTTHAFAANPAAMMINQYPPGVSPPEIPYGHLHRPDVAEDAMGSASFGEIPGRLTLNNRKYNVTVAEILRRVRAPESFNLSLLGSLLRKGKTGGNSLSLRDEMAKLGIKIDVGRRKCSRITPFTSMLESEALALAADVDAEMVRTFPYADLAKALVARIGPLAHPQEIHAARAGFNAAGRIARSLGEAIESLRLPVAERIPHVVVDNAHLMLPYCSLTHGYGPDACISWLGNLRTVFEVAANSLDDLI